MGDFDVSLMSSNDVVAGFKKCSRVYHVYSVWCSPGLQILMLELCNQCRGTRGRAEVVKDDAS